MRGHHTRLLSSEGWWWVVCEGVVHHVWTTYTLAWKPWFMYCCLLGWQTLFAPVLQAFQVDPAFALIQMQAQASPSKFLQLPHIIKAIENEKWMCRHYGWDPPSSHRQILNQWFPSMNGFILTHCSALMRSTVLLHPEASLVWYSYHSIGTKTRVSYIASMQVHICNCSIHLFTVVTGSLVVYDLSCSCHFAITSVAPVASSPTNIFFLCPCSMWC